MQKHLEEELVELKEKLFQMSDLTMDLLRDAVKSVKELDTHLAKEVTQRDNCIDQMEKEIDELCVRILVTQQPTASDLRFILSVLKINTDIERIADLACTVARQTKKIENTETVLPLSEIPKMAEVCAEMLTDALRSITEKDVKLALHVIDEDSMINEIDSRIYKELYSSMTANPGSISGAMAVIKASKSLERIGDHIKNIAERSIYYIRGEDIRHSKEMLNSCRDED